MLRFIQFIVERAALSSSGEKAERHAATYLDPYVGGGEHGITHVLKTKTRIGDTVHPAGTKITLHATKDEQGGRIIRGKRGMLHSVVSVGDGPKQEIPNSRIEKPEGVGGANALNKYYGDAFETHAALHIHELTHSRHNPDPEHTARIAQIRSQNEAARAKLPEAMAKEAERLGKNAAESFVKGLQKSRGISPEDIHEVHRTNRGISNAIEREVSQHKNPHDVVIKTKSGHIDGASLKARSGTLSNNGLATFDQKSTFNGKHTNLTGIWRQHNSGAAAAQHHAESFNTGTPEEQRAHIHYLMKSHPDVPYHYVVGDEKKSMPIEEHPNVVATNKAKSFVATHSGTNTKIHDDQGNHILTIEHRRPGKNRSPQANAKFGSMNKKSVEKPEE